MVSTELRCRYPDVGLVLHWEGSALVVNVSGELDLCTAPVLDDFLVAAADASDEVIVDLHAVTFADVLGVTPIVRHIEAMRSGGRRMTVRNMTARVARLRCLPPLAPLFDAAGISSRSDVG